MKNENTQLIIKSPSFIDNGFMPKKHTAFAENISPAFKLKNIDANAVSIAIAMNDLDIPFVNEFNHWIIWNIPVTDEIPENIPHGSAVDSLGGAVQGIGYGKNGYCGPKQPVFIRSVHRYIFRFYILDCNIDLNSNCGKAEIINEIKGHILQQGSITAKYKR